MAQGRLKALIRDDWPEWRSMSARGRRRVIAAYLAGKQAAHNGESVKPWAGRTFPYDSMLGRLWRLGHMDQSAKESA